MKVWLLVCFVMQGCTPTLSVIVFDNKEACMSEKQAEKERGKYSTIFCTEEKVYHE